MIAGFHGHVILLFVFDLFVIASASCRGPLFHCFPVIAMTNQFNRFL